MFFFEAHPYLRAIVATWLVTDRQPVNRYSIDHGDQILTIGRQMIDMSRWDDATELLVEQKALRRSGDEFIPTAYGIFAAWEDR